MSDVAEISTGNLKNSQIVHQRGLLISLSPPRISQQDQNSHTSVDAPRSTAVLGHKHVITTLKSVVVRVNRFSTDTGIIRHCSDGLKEPEEHVIISQCSSELLNGPGVIGAQRCGNELIDLHPLVAKTQINGDVSFSAKLSLTGMPDVAEISAGNLKGSQIGHQYGWLISLSSPRISQQDQNSHTSVDALRSTAVLGHKHVTTTPKSVVVRVNRFTDTGIIRHCSDGLKEPEEHVIIAQCSSELLNGSGVIGAQRCGNEVIDLQLLEAKTQINEDVNVYFQKSWKALASELLTRLQLDLITQEGSTAHPLEFTESHFFGDFLQNHLGASEPFFVRIKEEPQIWFLSVQYLRFIFDCHSRTAFDRFASKIILLLSSRLWCDSSTKGRKYEVLLLSPALKMSQSFPSLRSPYSFNEMKSIICNIDYFTFCLSVLSSPKPSSRIYHVGSAISAALSSPLRGSSGGSFPEQRLVIERTYHVSLVEKVACLFFENLRNSSVFVVAESKKVFITLPGIDKSGLNRLCSSSQHVYENKKETSCERSLLDRCKSISTVGGIEEYSGETCNLTAKSKPSYPGWILETSDSIPLASCRKQESDSKGIPIVDVLQEENEKDEVFHLFSNLLDGIHTNEDVCLCFPLYSWNQIRSPSQSDEALDSDAVFPLANDSHSTDSSNGNDLPRIQMLWAEGVKSVDDPNECGSNLQRDQNEFESCLYIDREQVTENPPTFCNNNTLPCAKLPERLLLDECYLPNREEGSTTIEYSFSFVENKDDQRENFSSITEESEKEKLNVTLDPISDSQDIFERDSVSSLGSDGEVQCNAWLGGLVGHQNQVQDCSDACRQSIAGLSPLASSKKTHAGTQTEDCFGPVLANLKDKLAATQNICSELQQKINWQEKQLELFKEETHKIQADLGRYQFLEEKEKRMKAMSVRRHELLGHIVSGGVTTDYDGSCSFNNLPDSSVSVVNEASKHSKGKSLLGKRSELQENAAGSAPDISVGLQDKHLDDQLDIQDRNQLFFYGTSLTSSSNAEHFQENDTTLSEERADHEHKQCSLLPCSQRSENMDDVAPESSMNTECRLSSSRGAFIANDYPWKSKSFNASVSSSSTQSATNSKISCDNSHNLTCFEENRKPSGGTGLDWKDENVEVPGPHAADGEEMVERAVDSVGDESLTALPPGTNTRAVSAANRPSSCETNWERLGARPKQRQHSLVPERPREPLVSATDGLAANFLARHTQDKALQDSLHQNISTPSPVFSENSRGTSNVDGHAPEPNQATANFGGLSFTTETDPNRRKENPFLSVFREKFDRNCIEGDYSHKHLYNNTSDVPDGPFYEPLGEGNLSRFRNYSLRSTTSAANSHAFQSGFVENSHVLARNNHHEEVQDLSVLPDSCSAFNSEPTNTTQLHWSIPGGVSMVLPSGCMTTFEDACLAQGSTHDTSILEPRYGDADSYKSSMLNNRDFGTDSVESSDNSLLALERRVAEASALVERVLREREEREQFGREIERKEQLIREQRAKERRDKEERELREAENWPQQQEAITARSQWLCEHYQRHCRVRFPCCTQFYPCHRCHNISKACENEEAKACHATHLKCSHCQEEQEIGEDSAHCRKCGGKMSAYFCAICKHFTSIDKNPYHCDKCGICRIHQDKSFHCEVCNVCLDKRLEGNHKCRPDSGHDECCICLEDAFSGCQILPCSHKVHRECAIAMIQNGIRTCPICRHPLYSQPRE